MNIKVIPTTFFLKQLKELNQKAKDLIISKINLIKENPYRYKKIHSKNYRHLHRIRLNINNNEFRLVYHVISPDVLLVCLLERKHDYKDLEKLLSKSLS